MSEKGDVNKHIISNHNSQRNETHFNLINNRNIINPNSSTTFNTNKKGRKRKDSAEKETHTVILLVIIENFIGDYL